MTFKTRRSYKHYFFTIPLIFCTPKTEAMDKPETPQIMAQQSTPQEIVQNQTIDISDSDWWGYKINGAISKSAFESNTTRLRFENKKSIGGEIRSPITYLFCPKQDEQNILTSLTIQTNNLFVNDNASDQKASNFDLDRLNPNTFCASVNSISMENFTKRENFKAELEFNFKEDLFESVHTIVTLIRKNFVLLEHIIVTADDDSPPNHRWKFPKEIQVLMGGNPYSVWALNFGEECNSGCNRGGKPYIRSFEEEEKSFELFFKAYEKHHYKTKVEPEEYKLTLIAGGSCHSPIYGNFNKDPFFTITCTTGRFEKLNMNLYVHAKF